MRTRLFLAALAATAVAVAGCGGDDYSMATVSGTVTLDGKPLADAYVEFQPELPGKGVDPGPGSVGKTDAAGKFTLKSQLAPNRQGAVVGKHHVRISCFDGKSGGGALDGGDQPDADPNPKRRKKKSDKPVVPARYNETTELRFVVPAAGTTKADFELKLK